jgi:ubiquinone/menaquinone biosynthesis C-methylase UbiE
MGTDKWASWLLTRRDGGNAEVRRKHAPSLAAFRDGVLDRASIGAGDIVLDLGAGSGLIGLGALDLVGDTGQVIFSDISAALLDECRRQTGGDERCSFVEMSADDLGPIADASVDVVTTRSVLMYLPDKRAAFTEIARVLRPGGRLSIFEPVNSFLVGRHTDRLLGLDVSPLADLAAKVLTAYDGESLILDFDERDLLAWTERAGFTSIEMDYRAQVDVPMDAAPGEWETLQHTAPNPLVPTYAEAMAATLTAAERDRLEEYVRAQFAAGAPRHSSMATVFLRAVRR